MHFLFASCVCPSKQTDISRLEISEKEILKMKQLKIYETKICIPANVKIKKNKNNLFFYGPLGCTELNLTKLDKFGMLALHFDNKSKKNFFF